MIWRDILIDRRPSDDELLRALAGVFQITSDAIVIDPVTGHVFATAPRRGTVRLVATTGSLQTTVGVRTIRAATAGTVAQDGAAQDGAPVPE